METSIPKEIQEKIESINLEQDNKQYMLTIKLKETQLTLVLSEQEIQNLFFVKKMTLQEIKELNNYFNGLNSCEQFCKYLKGLIDNKQLTIIKKEKNLCLSFTVEYLFEKKNIELILLPKEKDQNELVKGFYEEIYALKEKTKILESENKKLTNIISGLKTDNENLKQEMKNLKEEIKEAKSLIEPIKKLKEININKYTLYNDKSLIMKEDELNFIKKEMKDRMDKEIKELKKLYQATIDGDSAQMFHLKCDGVQNTLVIIKSAGNRRFGGFTTKKWKIDNNGGWALDQNAFLFSLDKKKIYPYKGREDYNYNENQIAAISFLYNSGPIFGGYAKYKSGLNLDNNFDIYICSNCIQDNKLSYTYEANTNSSYNFFVDKDKNALSEDGKKGCIYIADYEVFQVIFE